jgi:hypothetical protein
LWFMAEDGDGFGRLNSLDSGVRRNDGSLL